MATDIVRDINVWEPFARAAWAWRSNHGHRTRKWIAMDSETFVLEARTPAGFLCFRVKFPNGKRCHCETLAEAQEYAERHASANLI